jgi:GAF domain-containing protein
MPLLLLLGVALAVAVVAWLVKRRWDDREAMRRFQQEQRVAAEQAEAQRRRDFLEHVSEVLASSPDYESTLAAVARLAVPAVADWCVVDLLRQDGSVETVAMAHVDPEKVELIRALRAAYPVDPNAKAGVGAVIRLGASRVYPDIAPQDLAAIARDPEQLRIALALGMTSAVAVPLLIGGRRLGVLSLMTAESGRRFVRADLPFAEELAQRIAVAIDSVKP